MTFEETPFKQIIKRSFTQVEILKDGINTKQFLEASDCLINMFDLFGNSAFSVVQNDMSNNVKKINHRYLESPNEYNTIELLMLKESHLKKRQATEAVLWLKRGLDFTAQSLLHSLDNPNEELTVSFSLAYDKVLRPHHSFIVRPVFNLAMNACPWRKDFYSNIGIETDETRKLMKEWLNSLIHIIEILDNVFKVNPNYTKH